MRSGQNARVFVFLGAVKEVILYSLGAVERGPTISTGLPIGLSPSGLRPSGLISSSVGEVEIRNCEELPGP